jgi:hypothetical protein
MNLFVTIFGGMLLTAVLYGLGRFVRLSNFWSAVIAGAMPTVAYLIYSVIRQPSLDVITIHVVAYPTVAVLFGLLYGSKADHSANMHWIPKLIVLFFVLLTLLMGAFVYIARQGVPPSLAQLLLPDAKGKILHTGFAGVVDHSQEAANGIPYHLDMQNKLEKLGWRLEITGLSDLSDGVESPVEVLINDRETRPVENVAVSLELSRPGQRGEVQLALSGGLGGYHGTLPGLQRGHWVAHVKLAQADGKTIDLEHDVEVR